MGRKIFISYKYADSSVRRITGNWWDTNTVRNYADKIEEDIDSTDHIYKGESDGEDLSQLSDETIWKKLRDRIYDSTLTIVMISKGMKISGKPDKDQWIPREVSYSLKEMSRFNSGGKAISSSSNALLAVVIPDESNSYSYFTYNRNCCSSGCITFQYDPIFNILKNNMFNLKKPDVKDCNGGSSIHYGDYNYMTVVKWDDFISDMNKYINKAYEIQANIDNYEICKEV